MTPVTAHSGHSTRVGPVLNRSPEQRSCMSGVLFVLILISLKLTHRIAELGSNGATGPPQTSVPWFSQSHMTLPGKVIPAFKEMRSVTFGTIS